jgi:hypothetical protein
LRSIASHKIWSSRRRGKCRRSRFRQTRPSRCYHGLEVLGGGSVLTGFVLGAIGVFVIEKKFVEASAFALSGAVLTFFGFMHDESAGLAATPTVAIAYTIIAVFLFGLSRRRC